MQYRPYSSFWLLVRGGFLPLCFLVLFLAPASAQTQSDTLTRPVPEAVVVDSLTTLKEVNRGPKNALLWAAIPGGGQVYNKRWWKVPLVYGGLLGMIAYADFNQTRYTRFITNLEARCLGEGAVVMPPFEECIPSFPDFPESVPTAALIRGRDAADQARQTAYIGIFVVYLLQAVEAYTDAHLQDFDISDDLSFRLGPIPQADGSLAAGLTVPLSSGRRQAREEQKVNRLRATAR